jgi:hypothetical protein
MTIPDYILGSMFAAILSLQAWQLLSIVNMKVEIAELKAVMRIMAKNYENLEN